ncbi:recombinase family protein (plasmid) [Streptomyces sp. BI20]|uniref:recombinase family protein n=1 Tax=Streptomyces sp. BI20 TaxID=3403460 RepID=UPI003C71716F
MATTRLLGALRESKLREHSDSFEGQDNDVQRVILSTGATLVHMTRDRDVSGREVRIFDRPELGPWIKKPNLFDGIAVQKIDRLTRRPVDIYLFLEWLTANGKFLISAQGDDTRTKAGRQRVEMMAMVGSWEWDAIQERNQDSHERARLAGRYHGGVVPYGYQVTGTKGNYYLEPHPEESAIVQGIVAEVIAGLSYEAIANRLNEDEVPTPKWGKHWVAATIQYIVTSPALRGRAVHKGDEVIGEDGMPVQKAVPLISERTYRALKKVTDAKKAKYVPRNRSDRTELIRVIVCIGCGKNNNRHRGRKGTPYRYRCMNKKCPLQGIRQEEIWSVLDDYMRLFGSGVEIHELEVTPGQDNREEIQELKDRLKRLRQSREDGDWDDDLDAYMSRRDKLRERVKALEADPIIPDKETWTSTGKSYTDFWANATRLEKGDELRRINFYLVVDPRVPAQEKGQFTSGRYRVVAPSQWERWKVLGMPKKR